MKRTKSDRAQSSFSTEIITRSSILQASGCHPTSPLDLRDKVEVVGMAPAEECEPEMFVPPLLWSERAFAFCCTLHAYHRQDVLRFPKLAQRMRRRFLLDAFLPGFSTRGNGSRCIFGVLTLSGGNRSSNTSIRASLSPLTNRVSFPCSSRSPKHRVPKGGVSNAGSPQ